MTNPLNLSCNIVDLRYDFINFNFEKLLSAEATVTSIVNNILKTIHAFGKDFNSLYNLVH